MRARLLNSWLRLLLVWWGGSTLWWAMSDTRVGVSLERLVHHHVDVGVFTSGIDALRVLWHWTVPVLSLTAAAALAGAWVVWMGFVLVKRKQAQRVVTHAGSAWRGMSMSMAELEMPRWVGLPMRDISIDAEGALAKRFSQMSDPQRRLMAEVLGVLAAHPDAFVGDGHQGTLLDHTLHVLEQLPSTCLDPLLPIAAAAHDAGKVLAWKKVDGAWQRNGWHDDLGGLLLSGLPAASELPEKEFRILVCTLRYAHKRDKTPVLAEYADTERLHRIQDAMTSADHSATAVEKARVRETLDKPALLRRAFIDALPQMTFQIPGIRKGALAAGWRKGSRIYLSEIRLREAISAAMLQIDANAAAAWNIPRQKGQIAEQTADLLAVFADEGWLVSTIEAWRAEPALWYVKAGKASLKAIIILDLPDDLLSKLPGNAPYEMTVTGPFFESSTKPEMPEKSDSVKARRLEGSSRKPKSPRPPKTEAAAPVPKPEPDPPPERPSPQDPDKTQSGGDRMRKAALRRAAGRRE